MFDYTELIKLIPSGPVVVALVGAGGKTTTMYALGKHYASKGNKVALTTTTKLFIPEKNQVDEVIYQKQLDLSNLEAGKVVLYVKEKYDQVKLRGFDPETVAAVNNDSFDVLINEADGAKCKAIKAPRADEPLISDNTNLVVGIIGLDVIGAYADADKVHRRELFEQITGCKATDQITEKDIASLVMHPLGLFKNVKIEMQKILMLTKADDKKRINSAMEIKKLLQDFDGEILWI